MRNHVPRQRPPWWPENATWPPDRPWRSERGRFFRRVGCLIIVLGLLSLVGCGTLFSLIFNLPGLVHLPESGSGFARALGAFIVITAIGSMIMAGRALRRAAVPVADVMEAAAKVADGNYAVRVEERGPHEVRALARSFNTMTTRLQVNDEQRRALLADVTHELRTPLTVLQGNLEGMLDGIYPPDTAHLESTLEETRVMSRLIDDLRTLSLSESGALKLQRESVDLNELIQEVAELFQSTADSAGVQLIMVGQPDLPLLEADPWRLRQVLTNLIANALHYTPNQGQIHVRCFADGTDRITVVISDTGRGIAPEDLPHIFDRFYKSSDSRGTGLGLAIAKNLVIAHGGEINAQSTPGQGTTITFTLPK